MLKEYDKGLLKGMKIALEVIDNAKYNIEDEFDAETALDKIILEEAQRGIKYAYEQLEMQLDELEDELEEPEEEKVDEEKTKKFRELEKEAFKIKGAEEVIHAGDKIVVKLGDSSHKKEEPKEIPSEEKKEASKYTYSAYRIKGDK